MFVARLIWAAAAFFAGREVVGFLIEQLEDTGPRPGPEPIPALTEGEGEVGSETEHDEARVVVDDPEASTSADERALHEANRALAFTVGGVAAVGLGAVFPAVRLLTVPLLIVGMAPVARRAWQDFRDERRLTYPIVELAQAGVELAYGKLFLTAGGLLLYTGGNRMLVSTRRRVHQTLIDALAEPGEGAWVLRDGAELLVALEEVDVGDLVIVRAGDTIPVDGRIVEGVIGVDQSALTGESGLLELRAGDSVLAASSVLSGLATIEAERTGSETVMARVAALLASATSYEQALMARVSRVTDRSVRPTLAMAGFGLLTRGPAGLVSGLWTNTLDMIWVSSPLSMLNTIEAAARAEILIKDGRSLELLAEIDTVVFDKTGTLTVDELELVEIHNAGERDDRTVLRYAAALEQRQRHPLARAIVRAAGEDEPLPEAEDHTITLGYGVRATIEGHAVMIGSRRYFAEAGIAVALGESEAIVEAAAARGHSLVFLAIAGRYAAAFEFAPTIRADARAVVDELRGHGLDLIILSGDDEGPTRIVAAELGIPRYVARALPEDKVEVIARLQAEGRRVCFVGDGINDALAMNRANVSVSLAEASAIALESAQVILRADGLSRLPILFELGRHFDRDQRTIVGVALATTAVNSAGMIFAGFELLPIVGLYIASIGVSLTAALMPNFRDYEVEAAVAGAPARAALTAG